MRGEKDGAGRTSAEATLVACVGGRRALEVEEGEGPVDAMSRALRKALGGLYPELADVRLTDYKVRVLTPEEGTAASVRVLIEHQDGERAWHTVGVSTNLLEASWQALADGLRYGLLRSGVAPPAARTSEQAATGVAVTSVG